MSFRGKLRDTFYITGRSSSLTTTDLESPASSSSAFKNSAFEPDYDVTEQPDPHETTMKEIHNTTGQPDPRQTTSNGAYEMTVLDAKDSSARKDEFTEIIRHDTDASDKYEDLPEEQSTPKPRCGISWLKFALIAMVIFGAFTAIIILIIALRDPTPPAKKNGCRALNVNLNQSIIIVCYTGYDNDCNITITPPPTAWHSGTVLLTKQQINNSGWTMNYISNKNITLIGPEAKCSSEGEYKINITDTVRNSSTIQTTKLEINANPELVTDPKDTTSNASKEASCRSQTQCKEGYTLKMLPSTYPTTEFNQTCYTHYYDPVGWTTHCTGRIQNYMSNTSCTITCILSDNIITKARNVSIC